MATRNINKSAAATKPAGDSTKGIKVVSRPAQFRRGGYAFSAEPTTIRLSDITQEQYDAIVEEKMLVVTLVDMPPAEEAGETAKE